MNNDFEWIVYFIVLPALAGAVLSAITFSLWLNFSGNPQSCNLRLGTADTGVITITVKASDDDAAPNRGDGRQGRYGSERDFIF